MSIITAVQGAKNALTVSGLSSLASSTYAVSNAYNAAVNNPLDVIIEVDLATSNTPSGNKQVAVFAKASLDGSAFQSGPESGTSTTDEADLTFVGSVPVGSATTSHSKVFSLFNAFGFIPKQFKIVLKNDLGVSLTAGSVYTAEITGAVA